MGEPRELFRKIRRQGGFRAGLEWVGQDLEETFSPGAEGGARMFFGPIASLQLLRDRLTLVAGPSLGLEGMIRDWEITQGEDDAVGQKQWKRGTQRWVSVLTIRVSMYLSRERLVSFC